MRQVLLTTCALSLVVFTTVVLADPPTVKPRRETSSPGERLDEQEKKARSRDQQHINPNGSARQPENEKTTPGKAGLHRIVLVLDRSESMTRPIKLPRPRPVKMKIKGKKPNRFRPKPFRKTTNQKRMLTALAYYFRLQQNQSSEHGAIAFAHRSLKVLGGKFTNHLPALAVGINKAFAPRTPYDTRIWMASEVGLDLLINARKAKEQVTEHLILFSDGRPEKEKGSGESVLKRAKKEGIRIHVVLFLGNKRLTMDDAQQLKTLAQETGGLLFAIGNDQQVPVAMRMLARGLLGIK